MSLAATRYRIGYFSRKVVGYDFVTHTPFQFAEMTSFFKRQSQVERLVAGHLGACTYDYLSISSFMQVSL